MCASRVSGDLESQVWETNAQTGGTAGSMHVTSFMHLAYEHVHRLTWHAIYCISVDVFTLRCQQVSFITAGFVLDIHFRIWDHFATNDAEKTHIELFELRHIFVRRYAHAKQCVGARSGELWTIVLCTLWYHTVRYRTYRYVLTSKGLFKVSFQTKTSSR